MKKAKTIIKVLIIIAVLATIAVGAYFLKTKGLNYPESGEYTQNNILEEAKDYIKQGAIAGVIVLVYIMIRFNKLGVIKTGIETLLTVVGVECFWISITAIARLPINSLFFAILLFVFAGTVMVITSVYEKKIKTA